MEIFGWLDWVVIGAYFAALLALTWWGSLRSTHPTILFVLSTFRVEKESEQAPRGARGKLSRLDTSSTFLTNRSIAS
jgi:hypothetical protein